MIDMPSNVIGDRDPLRVFLALVLLAILVGGLIGTLVRLLRKAISEQHTEHLKHNREQ